MLDVLRNYLQMASGLTEATTSKAKEVVTGLLSTGMSLTQKAVPAPDMMGQVQELADDLVTTSKNNRDMLTAMIRAEVDKAVGRMGFVREDELAALRRHVQRLEKQIGDLQEATTTAPSASPTAQAAPIDAATGVWPSAVPDESDVIADAAVAAATEPVQEPEPAAPVEPAAAAAPIDVVGEAVDTPKKKKKKIIVDPASGA